MRLKRPTFRSIKSRAVVHVAVRPTHTGLSGSPRRLEERLFLEANRNHALTETVRGLRDTVDTLSREAAERAKAHAESKRMQCGIMSKRLASWLLDVFSGGVCSFRKPGISKHAHKP
jgi:hypothetical protein